LSNCSVFILGYGWLGEPLGHALSEAGYRVKGSTTRPDKAQRLRASGLDTEVFSLSMEENLAKALFPSLDYLIITYPPSKTQDYADTTARLLRQVSDDTRVIFISSTSVYPDLNRIVTEKDAFEGQLGSEGIFKAEEKVRALKGSKATILRCGGLIGGNRIPGKYFAGQSGLNNGHLLLNLVHLDDVIGLILAILDQGAFGYTWNVVAPKTRSRRELYQHFAESYGFEPPAFSEDNQALPFKIVDSSAIRQYLSYSFQHPDLLKMNRV
jgi:nucleoside-diphosphate-sugar epimerase